MESITRLTLTKQQIDEFIENGVLIVPNVLSKDEINNTTQCLHNSLLKYGVDSNNLKETGKNLNKLSTTGGAGGIIDLFYEPWRLDLATNPRIFSIVSQLWSNTYGKYSKNRNILSMIDQIIQYIDDDDDKNEQIDDDGSLYSHPFGSFDTNSGFIYMNRCCYRVPDEISNYHSSGSKKKRKLQRCLAPHLDCCPHDMFGENRNKLNMKQMQRWRPIQLFIALTDNHDQNTGGFECVKGFHHRFDEYFKNKTKMNLNNNQKDTICVGDFCRLLPNQDKNIFSKYQHIPYQSGSVILFDWRIPHANARYNKSNNVRMVVYTGFLPNVALNNKYVEQLKCYKNKHAPPDFWGHRNYSITNDNDTLTLQVDDNYKFTDLGEKLMSIKPWEL